jgi:hypothetical protein
MSEHDFIDLASYAEATPDRKFVRGNVIKARYVSHADTRTIEIAESENQPTVITHRDGDIIKEIEVACTCGVSTKISLEY